MYQLKRRRLGALALKTMLGLMVMILAGPASAQTIPETGRGDLGLSRTANTPLIAVVSLRSQRVTVYSARGKMLEAPVSTGKPGYETPAGIYSVLQKRRFHYSNLYNDAAMPFMQRLTWSGIALHAGELPGYPASHGCIRMPYGFAMQLFELSKRGLRVLVVRDDMSPVDFAHPTLFKPGPVQPEPGEDRAPGNVHLSSVQSGAHLENTALLPLPTRRSIAAAKEAAAEAAAKKADEARRAAARIGRDAAEFEDVLESAESAKRRAAARIEEADLLVGGSSAFAQELKDIKTKAQERLVAAQAQIDAIYAIGKAKIDAARAAREEAKTAEAARVTAQNEAMLAAGQMAPVSVFISRKTQRLYVRRAREPVFESAVTIRNPKAPIGTTIFTALNWTDDDAELRWNALSMYPHRASGFPRQRDGEPARTSPDAAKAALERISMPQDAIDRINELISPGSSLIISDEAMSRETGEATDFVVLMSGEPQGGTARRRPDPNVARGDDGPFSPGGITSFFSWW
jgi:hypothetical protein